MYMCAVQLVRPNVPASTIVLQFYISSPDKDMINIMSGGGNGMNPCLESANGMIPCLESANGMTPCLESSNDEEVDTKNVKNMHLNKHKGMFFSAAMKYKNEV